ncbi:Major facilitator superfamily domain, general substrate transporter [Cordyceps fumosorosea ARSEF 2679]|uniref:Major facilitator superfamily domain, general substrate transporter n=1 Tax=Cordyceps fumosorosea (strain ARSEF 2679) TaxID=1081104 RepID=A0A162MU43_CORFA|nr:Major facilitator superfamily domain, general substrate transporter [Cordyceps fumosorosea ARSEF 2679]OAA70429.1 Major facilitator superfamily domain, general substrate transporter [Cordyceps fumosorosea ARSEF 2679]
MSTTTVTTTSRKPSTATSCSTELTDAATLTSLDLPGATRPSQLTHADIERLGRERPPIFANTFIEVIFVMSIVMSLMMSEYFTSGFNIILPTLTDAVHIPEAARTWPTAVPNLAAGVTLLPFSRLCGQWSARVVYLGGHVWLAAWAAAAGLCSSATPLIVCRAMQGVGFGAFLPAGLSILGQVYRPGPRKNRVYCVYGAFAAVGFYFGIITAALTTQYADWRWYFFLGATLQCVVLSISYAVIPPQLNDVDPEARMDWLGLVTSVPALALINFAFSEGSHGPQGWATPYIIVCLVLGLLFLALTVYVQGWVSSQPLMPRRIFKPKYMIRLFVALFFFYGVNSIFLFYTSLYIGNVLRATPILAAAWYTPLFLGGLFLAAIGGMVLHLLSNQILLIISSLGFLFCVLLFAILPIDSGQPRGTLYWMYILPAMCCATIGIDLSFNVTNVFLTTALPKRDQAAVGGITNCLIYIGSSFCLGFSDLLISSIQKSLDSPLSLARQYRIGFWLGVGLAGIALLLTATMRLGSASAELTADEKEELRQIAEKEKLEAAKVALVADKEALLVKKDKLNN